MLECRPIYTLVSQTITFAEHILRWHYYFLADSYVMIQIVSCLIQTTNQFIHSFSCLFSTSINQVSSPVNQSSKHVSTHPLNQTANQNHELIYALSVYIHSNRNGTCVCVRLAVISLYVNHHFLKCLPGTELGIVIIRVLRSTNWGKEEALIDARRDSYL